MKPAKTGKNTGIAKALRVLAPRMSLADFESVMQIATSGHLRHLPPTVIAWQALASHVRHAHTEYDRLLEEGYDRDSARHFVLDDMNRVLAAWGSARRVSGEEEETISGV